MRVSPRVLIGERLLRRILACCATLLLACLSAAARGKLLWPPIRPPEPASNPRMIDCSSSLTTNSLVDLTMVCAGGSALPTHSQGRGWWDADPNRSQSRFAGCGTKQYRCRACSLDWYSSIVRSHLGICNRAIFRH